MKFALQKAKQANHDIVMYGVAQLYDLFFFHFTVLMNTTFSFE